MYSVREAAKKSSFLCGPATKRCATKEKGTFFNVRTKPGGGGKGENIFAAFLTQSYANSFWGDVVLDSFKNVSRDKYNILNHIYKKQMCSHFYYENLKCSRVIEEIAYLKKYSSLQERAHKIGFRW